MTTVHSDKPLILIVDDIPTNLHVLAAALKEDYRIKVATSGMLGLDLARREDRPELLLLDVMMPEMSGIEMLRHLRTDPRTAGIPVIFVSADTSEQNQLEGLELGADDYLTKPIVTKVLRARVRNILERKRFERQLRLAAHVFRHSGEAIMITDASNRIIDVNPAFVRMTGYEAEEVQGQNPRILSAGRTSREDYTEMWKSIIENGFWQGELWDRGKSGDVYPKWATISVVRGSNGEINYHIASFSNISEWKATEERIRHIAHHDALTGLPNRLYLSVSLERLLATARRESHEAAVLFIDLDGFKHVNDTLGHMVGDEMLIEVAKRLKTCVRESDTVARLGGDEFVVVIAGNDIVRAARQVADKIRENLTQPYQLGEHTLHTSPSIGISLFPNDGDDIQALMKSADAAMYHAKAMGRNNLRYFDPAMAQASAERLHLESGLHAALAERQFVLHYQPQIDTATGEIAGFEALVRWRHPTEGLILPDRFIPLAEESGLIISLGEWVLDMACRQLRTSLQDMGRGVRMAVNLSPLQLRHDGLVDCVRTTLERYGLAGTDLELEITESAAMKVADVTVHQLHALRDLGVILSVDDFGTGYSSLSHLKLLPIQNLKLDRSFVTDIETNPNDAAICNATIAMAHALGLRVIGEGVETEAQRVYLADLGCDIMQGYLFSKPLPSEDLLSWMKRRHGINSNECVDA